MSGGERRIRKYDLTKWPPDPRRCFSPPSGLTHEAHARDVEQVYLRCSQGSLEWLYPTGAIIVNLRPNTASRAPGPHTVCVKPAADSRGANVYLEKGGDLRLLLRERELALGRVHCFGLQEGALFVEAVPHRDISRRITAFQYELLSGPRAAQLHSLTGKRGAGAPEQTTVIDPPVFCHFFASSQGGA